MKTLVLFAFHILNPRVDNFFKNCIFQDDGVDFIVISNDLNNTVDVPAYVKVIKRKNIGYDFGAWSNGLMINNLYKKYDNFIFVNSSVIGPFMPIDFKGKWTDIYINGLQGNVKLFGSTINCIRNPLNCSHVQSYIFSMDKSTLEYLINCKIFSIVYYEKTFHGAVCNREIRMSREIIKKGWNIGSLMTYYKDVDFTFSTKKPSDYDFPFLDDIMFQQYYGKIWHPHDLVFIKGNRDVATT